MKKVISIICVILILGCIFAACGSSTAKTEPSVFVDTTDITTSEMPAEETVSAEEKFEPVVLVDNDIVTITFKGVERDESIPTLEHTCIKILIENKTDKNILVGVNDDTASINDFMISPFWGSTIDGNKKSNERISVYDSTLIENDIEPTGELKFEWTFHAYDNESWDKIMETDSISFVVN